MSNIFKIITLKDEAVLELYNWIDKELKPLPKKDDGTIDVAGFGLEGNDVDALRHAYVSGVYTLEFSEKTAEDLGRLNELTSFDFSTTSDASENMDFWNNEVGRRYGKKAKSHREIFDFLVNALKKNELIIDINDARKFKGEKIIKRKPKSLVITIQESNSGENIRYYDISLKQVYSKEEFVTLIKAGKYPDYSIRHENGLEIPISKRDRFDFNNLG